MFHGEAGAEGTVQRSSVPMKGIVILGLTNVCSPSSMPGTGRFGSRNTRGAGSEATKTGESASSDSNNLAAMVPTRRLVAGISGCEAVTVGDEEEDTGVVLCRCGVGEAGRSLGEAYR